MEDVARPGGSWLWRWGPVVLYAGGIFAASSIPGRAVPAPAIFGHDKIIHAIVFAGLAALIMRACRSVWASVGLCLAYGLLDELHQRFTPGRDPSGLDALADLIGAVAGAALVWALFHRPRAGRRDAHHP